MKTARTLVALVAAVFAVCAFAAESPVREPAKDKAIKAIVVRVNMTHGVDGGSYAKYGRWERGR